MTYTTQDLIAILDGELKANWKGKRVVLSSESRINDPVVTKLLNMSRVNKVFAYQDFRAQIHQYQQEHQVSGIIWRSCKFQDQSVHYPEIHNQLVPIKADKLILMQSKQLVVDFWHQVTANMQFWLAQAPGKDSNRNQEPSLDKSTPHQPISLEYAQKLIRQAEWAEIDATRNEVYLGLCWGDPEEYRYQWAKPKSGCDRIIASQTVPSSIKI